MLLEVKHVVILLYIWYDIAKIAQRLWVHPLLATFEDPLFMYVRLIELGLFHYTQLLVCLL